MDGSRKLDLSFLILDRGQIFKTLAQTSLNVDESAHVKKAAIEIVLYLIKSEHILDRQAWKIVNQVIIQPNLPLLESCINEHGGENFRVFSFLNFALKSGLNTNCLIEAQLDRDNFKVFFSNFALNAFLDIIFLIEAQLKLLSDNYCFSVTIVASR